MYGSGCIAVAFAKHWSRADITAIDIDSKALEVARRNIERHELESRIVLRQGDLLESIAAAPSFDLILSNPPYVSLAEYNTLDRSVREYEPKHALLAGDSGLEIIQRLEEQASERLVDGGYLLIELSPMLADAAESFFVAKERWKSVRFVKDLAKHKRVLVAKK